MNPWILLALAIFAEIIGTSLLKLSDGLTRLIPSIGLFLCYGAAFTLLSYALKSLELGVVYAIWSGVGTAAVAIIGLVVFGEQLTWMKGISLLLIIAGVVGLNLSGRGGG